MANFPHFGTITKAFTDRWGSHVEITTDGDETDDARTYTIPASMIGDTFKGHGGTRIVTEAAYQAWYDSKLALILNPERA